MSAKNYCMLGLPASGKTTFLAAFTYMLMEHTKEVSLHMKPGASPEGFTAQFREEIDRWTNFLPLNHTGVGQIHRMKYTLYSADEVPYILDVPDRSGETFRSMIEDRYIDDNMREDWSRADEILFFVNFEKMDMGDKDALFTEIPPKIQEIMAESSENASAGEKTFMFPDQYALVELLQMLYDIRKDITKIKFIISAWDKVQEENKEAGKILPEEIFQDKLPLVYQFICANTEEFAVQYWGVSAQGGDLQDEAEIERMVEEVEAMKRVQVVEPDGTISFDLSKIFLK